VGAVKVVSATPRGKSVSVCFVPPGHLLTHEWPGEGTARRELRVVSHDPLGTIVASWPARTVLGVLATLPPAQAMQLVTTTWRATTDVLLQKCHLLGLSLHDRVLAVLTTLARDFGRPHPDGIRIELKLTHLDLAGAAVGSRANVTRALEQLRTEGLVSVEQHRLVVTQRGLAAFGGSAGAVVAWTPGGSRPRVNGAHAGPASAATQ
jgi:CRP/FNR family transcriptional regulator